MNRIEGFITAHIGDPISDCDDNFSYNFEKCSFAVADGSSSDFFSKIYSRMLADKFVESSGQFYQEENIKDINAEWRTSVKSKLDEAGCKPGSFPYVRFQKLDPGCSTLIGLKFYEEDGEIKFVCSGLGDSVLFFVPEDAKTPTLQFSSYSNDEYSLDQSVVFGYTPVISRSYSTQWLENIKEYSSFLAKGVFYLMTDGMAEWILRTDNGTIEDKFSEIEKIHTQESFEVYVDNIRNKGAHNDDMTLLKIYIEEVCLNFDASGSIIYDYRKEQTEIEAHEAEKREEKRLAEEKLLSEQKAKQQSRNSLNWITGVIATQKKQNDEKLDNDTHRSQIDDKNSAITKTAQAKVHENNKQEEEKKIAEANAEKEEAVKAAIEETEAKCFKEQEEAVKAAIEETVAKCFKEQEEAVKAAIEETEAKCFKEQEEAVKAAIEETEVKCSKEQEEAVKAAIQEKDNEFKRLEEERLQKEQDAQQLKLQEQKETEEKEKLRIAEEDAKKKQLTYLLKNNYPWIIIAFLFFLNVFSWISNRSSSVNDTNASKSEYTKLVNAHKSDSINIKNLTDEVKSLKDVNNKLKKDISIHHKREKYIELYPTAYRNMMKIKE
ncbi:hypothetical protein FQN58_14075 [Bacteroides xylanisolvens]|uniref:protein phosphatase 2C domain-containing protein n=1 Tax=Bacteroides xylanisolvens TaxID=371601 RepID=UPI001BAC9F96|nr:protein phosphatase 2C domain-containing protein [Bacteroides xylanisolvens]QUR44255.1 hypothetical protein FQN58_14075 [Bacteroides xylanisolvens]